LDRYRVRAFRQPAILSCAHVARLRSEQSGLLNRDETMPLRVDRPRAFYP
jgi:hypothetical protein